MNDKTEPAESRPLRLELTLPGPICGCPMVLVLTSECFRPEHPDIPPEVGTLPENCWLFSPAQLEEMLNDLSSRVMLGYHIALQHRLKELENGTAPDHEHRESHHGTHH